MLADFEIEHLCKDLKLMEPYNPELLNPASIDVTVGDEITIENPNSTDPFDLKERFIKIDISSYTEENPYWVDPGEFVLAVLKERVNLPKWISVQFVLKSSRARAGWDQMAAGFADPGYGGNMTLELLNNLRFHKLPIFPGLKIGQLKFFKNSPVREAYGSTGRSHYQGDSTVATSWQGY